MNALKDKAREMRKREETEVVPPTAQVRSLSGSEKTMLSPDAAQSVMPPADPFAKEFYIEPEQSAVEPAVLGEENPLEIEALHDFSSLWFSHNQNA